MESPHGEGGPGIPWGEEEAQLSRCASGGSRGGDGSISEVPAQLSPQVPATTAELTRHDRASWLCPVDPQTGQ